MMRSTYLFLAVAIGCAADPRFPTVRFANAPIANAINDRLNVPAPPKRELALLDYYGYNYAYSRLVTSGRGASTPSTRCRTRRGSPTAPR
jgi:hypothetical protein